MKTSAMLSLLALIMALYPQASMGTQLSFSTFSALGIEILVVVRLDETVIPPLLKGLKYIRAKDSPQAAADGISAALGALRV